MRNTKINTLMNNDQFHSSFLSCEKDTETILKKLFIESRPYSDQLKRLLLINTKDCLTDLTNPIYKEKINKTSIADMRKLQYIRTNPKLLLMENDEVKSYVLITFDNFSSNKTNNFYRDCVIEIDIICNLDQWDLDGFAIRPIKIAGYIDGILNDSKLSGIGRLEFLGCNEMVLNENLGGYCLMYNATHGNDDLIEEEE